MLKDRFSGIKKKGRWVEEEHCRGTKWNIKIQCASKPLKKAKFYTH